MIMENVLCETIRVYALISYARQTSDTFLSLMVPTILLVGPVFFGVIAGSITDHISRPKLAYPIIALATFASVALISVQVGNTYLTWTLLIGVAILSYLSVNIRIAASKFAVDPQDYSRFHSGVVWVLQVAPVASPLIAGLIASGGSIVWMYFVILAACAFAGAAAFSIVISRSTRDHQSGITPKLTFGDVSRSSSAAARTVFSDVPLRSSVFIASLQNVLVFVSGSIATVQYQSTSNFELLGGLPLFVAGCGAFVSAPVAGLFKKKVGARRLLTISLFASVIAVAIQSLIALNPWMLTMVFLVGANGATTAVCAWDIRLERSSKSNIGSIAGLTSTLYKLPSIVVLPLVGLIANVKDSSVALISAVAIVCGLYALNFLSNVLTIQSRREDF